MANYRSFPLRDQKGVVSGSELLLVMLRLIREKDRVSLTIRCLLCDQFGRGASQTGCSPTALENGFGRSPKSYPSSEYEGERED